MYAIVSIAGQNLKLQKTSRSLYTVTGRRGASIEFDNVLLAENEGSLN